jgi:transcriptional regulator with XRE-family HTH domain
MVDIGKVLREAREKKNLSIREVSEQTLIREYYLAKIENNEFDKYDGFIHAYIRKYATFLWLNPVPLSTAYKELFSAEEGSKEQFVPVFKRRNYKGLVILALVIVLIVIVVSFLSIKKVPLQEPDNSPAVAPIEEIKPDETTPVISDEIVEEVTSGINIIIYADAKCWVGVTIDGKYTQLFINKGESKEFKGEEYIKILFGNARHAYVTKNGQNTGQVSENKDVVEVIYKP